MEEITETKGADLMDLMYIMFSYQRPRTMSMAVNSLFHQTKIRPNEIWVLDDKSDAGQQKGLTQFGIENSQPNMPINIVNLGKNYGIGWNFEQAFNIIKWKSPQICALLESDYVMRNEFMEDVLAVFKASPTTLGITFDHQDMYNAPKYTNEFAGIMKKEFGEDVPNRKDYYKDFELNTDRGPIMVKPVTNSCGCHFMHYQRINEMLDDLDADKYPEEEFCRDEFWGQINKACLGDDGTKVSASDGILSSTYTWFHNSWMNKLKLDKTKNFPWLVVLPSLGLHLASGGRNGQVGLPEGTTFLDKCSFPDNWETWTRLKT